MAVESNMLSLGTLAPDFSLSDVVTGKEIRLSSLPSSQATLIFFICNHCPYVKHINDELVNLGKDYIARGVRFLAISSNDVAQYPEDAPDKMKEVAETLGYPFPYLYDPSQQVARAYDAACTPDFYLFDKTMSLVYRGQLDDSRPKNNLPVTGKDLRQAIDLVLAGKAVPAEQRPSVGCSIKWKNN